MSAHFKMPSVAVDVRARDEGGVSIAAWFPTYEWSADADHHAFVELVTSALDNADIQLMGSIKHGRPTSSLVHDAERVVDRLVCDLFQQGRIRKDPDYELWTCEVGR